MDLYANFDLWVVDGWPPRPLLLLWIWFSWCWYYCCWLPRSLFPLPLPLPLPFLHIEWLSVETFNVYFSFSYWLIFLLINNKQLCNSLIESVSISFDSSIQRTTKLKFCYHRSKNLLDNGDVLQILSMDSYLVSDCHRSCEIICNRLAWLHASSLKFGLKSLKLHPLCLRISLILLLHGVPNLLEGIFAKKIVSKMARSIVWKR